LQQGWQQLEVFAFSGSLRACVIGVHKGLRSGRWKNQKVGHFPLTGNASLRPAHKSLKELEGEERPIRSLIGSFPFPEPFVSDWWSAVIAPIEWVIPFLECQRLIRVKTIFSGITGRRNAITIFISVNKFVEAFTFHSNQIKWPSAVTFSISIENSSLVWQFEGRVYLRGLSVFPAAGERQSHRFCKTVQNDEDLRLALLTM
jgi:hypothetical protein